MTSPVIVNVDSRIKSKAMRKARLAGLPFSSVIKLAIRAYAEGRLNIDLFASGEDFNAKTSQEIRTALADIAIGKNLSPSFSSANEMAKHLRK